MAAGSQETSLSCCVVKGCCEAPQMFSSLSFSSAWWREDDDRFHLCEVALTCNDEVNVDFTMSSKELGGSL